jgi:hypothetical protein
MNHMKYFSNSDNSYLNSKPLVLPEVDIVLLYKKHISSIKDRTYSESTKEFLGQNI